MFKHLTSQIKAGKINPLYFIVLAAGIIIISIGINYYKNSQDNINKLKIANSNTQKELVKLKSVDQYKKNKDLESQIKNIETTYSQAVKVYESVADLRDQKKNTSEYDKLLAQGLEYLSNRNYSSASSVLNQINSQIAQDNAKAAASASVVGNTDNVAVNNTAPGSGFSRQKVHTDFGDFLVDIVAADMNSTRVVVDTASDSDCHDNCPVLSLGDYVSRSGAFAGVNGSYFCPATYPSCAGKTNSFDTLIMNKNKHYLNSDNNVYSNVPAAIFQSGSIRYVGQSSEWGRDTGVDGVIANQPLLVSGGNVVFGGDDEVKRSGAGNRSFVGSTGSTAYIGVVYGASAAQMARILKTMGIQNALNLDSGGSTALWSGGYKVGPGRNIPNAVLFIRK